MKTLTEKKRKEEIYWFVNSKAGKPYTETAWYRCIGITQFIRDITKENEIAGLIIPDGNEDRNNIGFILGEKVKK